MPNNTSNCRDIANEIKTQALDALQKNHTKNNKKKRAKRKKTAEITEKFNAILALLNNIESLYKQLSSRKATDQKINTVAHYTLTALFITTFGTNIYNLVMQIHSDDDTQHNRLDLIGEWPVLYNWLFFMFLEAIGTGCKHFNCFANDITPLEELTLPENCSALQKLNHIKEALTEQESILLNYAEQMRLDRLNLTSYKRAAGIVKNTFSSTIFTSSSAFFFPNLFGEQLSRFLPRVISEIGLVLPEKTISDYGKHQAQARLNAR